MPRSFRNFINSAAPLVAVHVAWCVACSAVPGPEVAARRQAIIFGEDERVEARDYDDELFVEFATEVVGALVPREYLLAGSDCNWRLEGPSLDQCAGLCPEEKWGEQPCLATCTAVLIAPDTILTAGHCVREGLERNLLFVRGYALGDPFPQVAVDQVHELAELLSHVDGDIATETGQDFALVRLQTPVALPFSDTGTNTQSLAVGDPLVVIGASEALPMKIDAGGRVFDASSADYLELTSDTFAGNSGSPVFTREGTLVGIIVGGNRDYEWDEAAACSRRRQLAEPEERAELMVRVDVIAEAMSASLQERQFSTTGTECPEVPVQAPTEPAVSNLSDPAACAFSLPSSGLGRGRTLLAPCAWLFCMVFLSLRRRLFHGRGGVSTFVTLQARTPES